MSEFEDTIIKESSLGSTPMETLVPIIILTTSGGKQE